MVLPNLNAALRRGVAAFLSEAEADDIAEAVSSSAVNFLSYNEDDEELTVHFNSGSIYRYHDVPKQRAKYFIESASSHGRYFVRKIRNNYIYERVI